MKFGVVIRYIVYSIDRLTVQIQVVIEELTQLVL